jgi:hypothetical protein
MSFFSATIDGRNLIYGHKLHIGIPYRGKRFWTHQTPPSCLPTLLILKIDFKRNKMNCELMLTYDTPALRQSGSRNLTGPKTLPTIWGTYITIDARYLIFGHKLHIGMPYCGKRFWTRQIPTSCSITNLLGISFCVHIRQVFGLYRLN